MAVLNMPSVLVTLWTTGNKALMSHCLEYTALQFARVKLILQKLKLLCVSYHNKGAREREKERERERESVVVFQLSSIFSPINNRTIYQSLASPDPAHLVWLLGDLLFVIVVVIVVVVVVVAVVIAVVASLSLLSSLLSPLLSLQSLLSLVSSSRAKVQANVAPITLIIHPPMTNSIKLKYASKKFTDRNYWIIQFNKTYFDDSSILQQQCC